jgi:hypothetical protein
VAIAFEGLLADDHSELLLAGATILRKVAGGLPGRRGRRVRLRIFGDEPQVRPVEIDGGTTGAFGYTPVQLFVGARDLLGAGRGLCLVLPALADIGCSLAQAVGAAAVGARRLG